MAADHNGAVQILDLGADANVEVLVDNLNLIGQAVKQSGAHSVAVVAVMGTYRTGKSFLLDLLMRYLNYKIKNQAVYEKLREKGEGNDFDSIVAQDMTKILSNTGNHNESWYLGKEDCPQPPWVKEAIDPDSLSEGHDTKTGFIWKNGKEKCTQGIWIWSKPWVFTKPDGEKVAVLLMDTQGAWDDSMTKDQSATIFGLTALLSSKLIYNIQNRIEEDKLENLDYFTTFAQRACTGITDDDASPFGDLHLLIRDWVNFDDEFTIEQCKDQMKEHMEEFLNVEKVPEDSKDRVKRLKETFQSIHCFGLDHPGKAVTRPRFQGEISAIASDFLHLLDLFCADFFDDDFPQPSKPLGTRISAQSFVQVVLNFAEAFRSAQGMAIGLREAFVKIDIMKARDDALANFRQYLAKCVPANTVMDPDVLAKRVAEAKAAQLNHFELRLRIFKPTEDTIREYMQTFELALDEACNPILIGNREQVEGATPKILASPFLCFGGWFLITHHILIVITGACYVVVHMRKWVAKEGVEYCSPVVWSGMYSDIKVWSMQRYRDAQAIWIQMHRVTPMEMKDALMSTTTKFGAQAMAAASAAQQATVQQPQQSGNATVVEMSERAVPGNNGVSQPMPKPAFRPR